MSATDDIRNALARGCHLLEDRRYEEWAQTFTEDLVYEAWSAEWNGFGERAGRAALLSWIMGAELANLPDLNRVFALVNMVIEVAESGVAATAASDVLMMSQYGGQPWTTRVGRYTDVLVHVGGQWLVTRRRVEWRAGNRLADDQVAGIAPVRETPA